MQHQTLIIYILVGLSVGMSALEVIMNLNEYVVSDTTQSIWAFAFILLSIMWAYADAKQKKFHKPFEFGFIAYVLWPVVFPWYLVATRGVEGVLLFLGFLLLWLVPWFAGLIAYVYFA